MDMQAMFGGQVHSQEKMSEEATATKRCTDMVMAYTASVCICVS
jgi:hypothetical protein